MTVKEIAVKDNFGRTIALPKQLRSFLDDNGFNYRELITYPNYVYEITRQFLGDVPSTDNVPAVTCRQQLEDDVINVFKGIVQIHIIGTNSAPAVIAWNNKLSRIDTVRFQVIKGED